jgi:hypothetical protein
MTANLAQTWLKTASAVLIGFGVVIAMSAHPALAGVTRLLLDLVFWPVDGAQSLASPETRLLSAIAGGMMIGWGVMFWLIAARLYPVDPELARTIILASIVVWFVADSLASIVAGGALNALLNIPFLLAFVWPLRRIAQPAEA